MKYLFIVTERRSANGICVNAVMERLVSDGHKVSCVSNKEFGDMSEEQKDSIDYFYVKPRWVYGINSRVIYSNDKKYVKSFLRFVSLVVNKVQLICSIGSWPVISRRYSKRIYEIAKKIYKDSPYDFIIPVYTQIDAIIAAIKIKEVYPTVKFIPYFLDSLAGGYGPKCFSQEWTIKRGLKWESRLLPYADQIIMMQSSKNFYTSRKSCISYYDKIVFLDIPLFRPVNSVTKPCRCSNRKKSIVYVGSIPIHIRSPRFFFDVFEHLNRNDIELVIIGSCSDEAQIEEYVFKDERIKRLPQISHDESVIYMSQADFLLNLGNNSTTMIPSKIFEYMSFGKPIISTAPINDEPSIAYLEKYGNALILKEMNQIEKEALKLDAFISSARDMESFKFKDQFYLNTPEAFVQIVQK